MKKVCRCFASFSSEQEHFTHGMYMKALIRSSGVKKFEPIMFYEGNFGIYSFIEHGRFDLFTSEERIRAVMYIPCVKCSCSELILAKHLHTFFFLT